MNQVHIERVVDAPREVVFAHYTDHAGWSDWARIGRVSLVRRGADHPNGVGSVRAFEALFGLREEVTEFHPPDRMEYRIIRGGFPLKDHRGQVTFESHPRGTRVTWTVEFQSRVPLLGRPTARAMRLAFSRVLERFARDVERRNDARG